MLPPSAILVIGYGNELRGDDGAGPCVASLVDRLGLPNVRVLTRLQLTPELSEALAQARLAVFVDASSVPGTDEVEVVELHPEASAHVSAHVSNPRSLLALAEALYGRRPRAWLVTVPGREFGFGVGLSKETVRGVERAVARVRELIRSLVGPGGRGHNAGHANPRQHAGDFRAAGSPQSGARFPRTGGAAGHP